MRGPRLPAETKAGARPGRRSPLGAIEGFVFAPESARRLASLRIGLFALLALRLAIGDYGFVAGQPAALFDPVSLFHLLPSMPSAGVVDVLQPLGVVVALLAAAGLWPRATFPAAFAIAVFLELMLNATGKIVHNEVLLVLCLLPLLATPRTSCRAWALRMPRRRRGAREEPAPPEKRPGVAYGWPIRLAMVIVGLAYLIAGLQKLRYSGLDWVTSDNLRYVLWSASDSQAEPNQLGLFVADRAALAHLLAGASLALELGFIVCLPVPRLRWILIPSVVGLHVGIRLMMGLDYSAQWLTVVIVFVDWPFVVDRLRSREWRALVPAVERR